MVALVGKNSPVGTGDIEVQVQSLGWEDPQEEGMQPTAVLLPGESHEQRSLAGYSLWGHKEPNTTEEEILHKEHFRDEKASFKMYSIPFLELFKNRVGEAANILLFMMGQRADGEWGVDKGGMARSDEVSGL